MSNEIHEYDVVIRFEAPLDRSERFRLGPAKVRVEIRVDASDAESAVAVGTATILSNITDSEDWTVHSGWASKRN